AAQYGVTIVETANIIPVTAATVVSPGVSSGTFSPTVDLVPGTTYTLHLQTTDATGVGTGEFSPVASATFTISDRPVVTAVAIDADTTVPFDAVNNVFPEFKWTHSDPDGDRMAGYQI